MCIGQIQVDILQKAHILYDNSYFDNLEVQQDFKESLDFNSSPTVKLHSSKGSVGCQEAI